MSETAHPDSRRCRQGDSYQRGDRSEKTSDFPDYKLVWQYRTVKGKVVTIHTKSQAFDLKKSPKERFLIYDTQTQIPSYFFLDELSKNISFSSKRGFYF